MYKGGVNIKNLDVQNFSPYDEAYPIKLLEEAFRMKIEESKDVTEKVISDLFKSKKYNINATSKGKERVRLVVDGTDDFMKNYQDGVIKLAKEKGHVVAQIKENGKYGRKLPIKEEKYMDGPNSIEIMNACQLQSIADSLQQLSDQIATLDENIKEVLKGQQNDRLGFYYSGVAQYIEANNISDIDLKKQLISQSLKSLNDAKYQLILSIQSDINYLVRREYESDKKQKFNLLNEKINNINKAFSAIHQATLMKAVIYCQYGEIDAMTCVFNEYAAFIKESIVPHSRLLTQCDIGDSGKVDGTWTNRARLLNGVTAIIKQLKTSSNVMYINVKGEIRNEST